MILNKESKKFNKGLEGFRGFNQKEWDELDPNLKALIAHKLIISGRGSALFKHIIGVLTNHEKRLKAIEAELKKKGDQMESTEQTVKELLQIFLRQNAVDKMVSKDGLIKVYMVNPDIVRVDIKMAKGEND